MLIEEAIRPGVRTARSGEGSTREWYRDAGLGRRSMTRRACGELTPAAKRG